MTPVERKSSIRKAPQADVVEELTKQSATASQVAGDGRPSPIGDVKAGKLPTGEVISAPANATTRPGPGRPRSKRRMEPFSSKIEIQLRDELDSYITERGLTVVDFLDQAIRDRLKRE